MRILAPVDNIRFDIEDALEKQTFSTLLPFIGMDKSAASVCELYVNSTCEKGNLCPFRHVKGDKSVVCKHWLRGLCKKGDECEFLHEYDMSKMPECYFYSKYSQCGNKECEFLHLDRESKIKDCPWYDRGFCRHGPNCKNRHLKKVICQNYLFGFCPDGPTCKFKHPKFELPVVDPSTQQKKQLFTCDFCGEKGHKISSCFKLNPENRQAFQSKQQAMNMSLAYQHEMNTSLGLSETNTSLNGDTSKNDDSMHKNDENKSMDQENKQNFQPNFPFYHRNNQGGHFPHQMSNLHHHHQHNFTEKYQPLPPSEVTCFKCGEKGHYANKCNKGVFAFLRNDSNT